MALGVGGAGTGIYVTFETQTDHNECIWLDWHNVKSILNTK